MKRYIFFTDTLAGVGGGQLYVAEKSRRLLQSGWEVSVVTVKDGEIIIPSLRRLTRVCLPAISYRFNAIPKKKRENIAAQISKGWHRDDRIVIESYNLRTALWGEFIAKRWHGTSLFYLLSENTLKLRGPEREFMERKLAQKLLYGITKNNIPKILENADDDTFLQALGCGINAGEIDEESGCEDDAKKEYVKNERFSVLVISRLDKRSGIEVLKSVEAFVRKHPESKMRLILVGDTPDKKDRERIITRLKENKNLEVDHRGYMFPVPQYIFDSADVAVGSSGSIRIAWDAGVPAISVDADDFKAIGILGETTRNHVYRDKEPAVEPEQLLEEIYKDYGEGRRSRTGRPKYYPTSKDDDKIYEKHLKVMEIRQKDYFNVEKLRPRGVIDLLYRIIRTYKR